MTSETTGKVRLIITWLLRVLLGLAFLAIGIEKLTGTMGTIPFFNAIGWGQWFSYATGALDTAGAHCSSSCRAGPPTVLPSQGRPAGFFLARERNVAND
jgi:hypothetical protein